MADVYSDSVPSHRTVVKWVAEFKDPTRTFEDAPRSGRPPAALTDESIRVVEKIVMRDRKISVQCVTDEWGISKTSVYGIIGNYLGMKKACTRWMPKLFTPLQRVNRVNCCEELVENCNQDRTEYFGCIMTRNETWTHHYEPLSQ